MWKINLKWLFADTAHKAFQIFDSRSDSETQNCQVHYLEAYPREQSRSEDSKHSTAATLTQSPCPSLGSTVKIAKAAERYEAEYRQSTDLHYSLKSQKTKPPKSKWETVKLSKKTNTKKCQEFSERWEKPEYQTKLRGKAWVSRT